MYQILEAAEVEAADSKSMVDEDDDATDPKIRTWKKKN